MTEPRSTDRQPMAHAPAPGHTGSAGDGNLAEPMPLGSFLRGVANIYDLAPKEVEPKAEAPKVRKTRAKQLSRPIGVMLAISILALFTVNLGSGETLGVLPEPLYGEWQTDYPAYRDRGFTIEAIQLTFRVGADRDSVTVHQIRRVEQSVTGESRMKFVVDYDVEGELATWKFQYILDGTIPIIRFDNQNDIVWTRVGPTKTPPG